MACLLPIMNAHCLEEAPVEEIIQALRERNAPVPVPLDLPTEEDLIDVEERLFLTLPREYREFLLTVSDVIYGSLEPATAADPNSHTYLPDLAAEAWNQGLPRHMIPICQYEGGYFCIDPDGGIHLWKDRRFADPQWENIWYWAEEVWLQN